MHDDPKPGVLQYRYPWVSAFTIRLAAPGSHELELFIAIVLFQNPWNTRDSTTLFAVSFARPTTCFGGMVANGEGKKGGTRMPVPGRKETTFSSLAAMDWVTASTLARLSATWHSDQKRGTPSVTQKTQPIHANKIRLLLWTHSVTVVGGSTLTGVRQLHASGPRTDFPGLRRVLSTRLCWLRPAPGRPGWPTFKQLQTKQQWLPHPHLSGTVNETGS